MLKKGDIIELKEGHTIYMKIPEHFVYANRTGEFEKLTSTEIIIGKNRNGMDTNFLKGRYVVTSTSFEGGSSPGERFSALPSDEYPDGHHVFCESLPNKLDEFSNDIRFQINFYQSGCFTAMIEDIEPVGQAKATWNEEEAE